jgi:hypothetical protein
MRIQIKGLDQVFKQLAGFSDRRMQSAIAEALNKTAAKARDDMKKTIATDLEGATSALSRNAPRITERADVGKLQATVALRNEVPGGGVPPSEFLARLDRGGMRTPKKYELALRAAGVLPDGWVTVPGRGAVLDSYGSVSRGQIAQILRDLQVRASGAYARTAKKARRDAGTYFAVPRGTRGLSPGIFMRTRDGVQAVLVFKSAANYRRMLNLQQRGVEVAQRELRGQLEQAIAKRVASLKARGSS